MPGKEIKGTSKIASYRHGGRAGFKHGKSVTVPLPHADIKVTTGWEGDPVSRKRSREKDHTLEIRKRPGLGAARGAARGSKG